MAYPTYQAPTFQAPTWDERKITGLTQAAAAPGVRRLRRQAGRALPGGYSPQEIQARRAAITGYGGGLAEIMGGARAAGRAQYGEQYGREFEAARLGHMGELEEARLGWQTGMEAERERLLGERTREAREWEASRAEQAEAARIRAEERAIGRARTMAGPSRAMGAVPGVPQRAGRFPGSVVTGGFRRGAQRAPTAFELSATPEVRKQQRQQEWQRLRAPWWKTQTPRAQGGPVGNQQYLVGEEGRETYVADDGSPIYPVGTTGPEVTTFSEPGQIIPNPRTLARQEGGSVEGMQINYEPPELSPEEQEAYDAAMIDYRKTYPADFEIAPENIEAEREGMLIKRRRGGRVRGKRPTIVSNWRELEASGMLPKGTGARVLKKQKLWDLKERAQVAGLEADIRKAQGAGRPTRPPMYDYLTRYLTSTKTSPGPGFGRSMGSWMLAAQPSKYFSILSYLQGGKPSYRGGGYGGGGSRAIEETPRPPTQYPGGGRAPMSPAYSAWLRRQGGE